MGGQVQDQFLLKLINWWNITVSVKHIVLIASGKMIEKKCYEKKNTHITKPSSFYILLNSEH